jgi:hypothetical protein
MLNHDPILLTEAFNVCMQYASIEITITLKYKLPRAEGGVTGSRSPVERDGLS